MSYDTWKTTDPRDSEPDWGHDITKDCDVRGFEHRWFEAEDGMVLCYDCGKVCDTNNEKETDNGQ